MHSSFVLGFGVKIICLFISKEVASYLGIQSVDHFDLADKAFRPVHGECNAEVSGVQLLFHINDMNLSVTINSLMTEDA